MSDVNPDLRAELHAIRTTTTETQVGVAELRGIINTMAATLDGRVALGERQHMALAARVENIANDVDSLNLSRAKIIGIAAATSGVLTLGLTVVQLWFGG